MCPQNSGTDDHCATQQQYSQHVGVQYRIAQQNSYQAEGGARRTKAEIQPLLRATGKTQQDQQYGRNNHVNNQQDGSGNYFFAAHGEGLGMRDRQLYRGDSQEKHGMNERDNGALAIVDNGKAVHKHASSVPKGPNIWL